MKIFPSLFALLFCFAAFSPPTFAQEEDNGVTQDTRTCIHATDIIHVAIQTPAISTNQVLTENEQFAGVATIAYEQVGYTCNATAAILRHTDRCPKCESQSTNWRSNKGNTSSIRLSSGTNMRLISHRRC